MVAYPLPLQNKSGFTQTIIRDVPLSRQAIFARPGSGPTTAATGLLSFGGRGANVMRGRALVAAWGIGVGACLGFVLSGCVGGGGAVSDSYAPKSALTSWSDAEWRRV